MSPWSAYQPGIAGERLEEQAATREPVELAGRVGDARGLEQRPAEPLELHGAGERRPDLRGGGRHDLLGEVREQRAFGSLETVEHVLAATRRRGRGAPRS